MSGHLSSDLGLWKMLHLFLQIHTQTLTYVKMMQTLKNTHKKIPKLLINLDSFLISLSGGVHS